KVEVRAYREHFETEDELVAAVADCEILVAIRERTRFTPSLFARLPKLKFISTQGMRNAAIDLDAAGARGVLVSGTGSPRTGTPQLAWGLILGFARHIPEERANMRAGGFWQTTIGMDIAGRTLGVLGLGVIGTKVSQVAKVFGMKVQAWSQNLTAEKCAAA